MSPAELQEFFDLVRAPQISPRYNIAPTQDVLTVTLNEEGLREPRVRKWGLVPSWSKTDAEAAKLINARSETAAERPAFRTAFRLRRCIIPASGFYEWQPVNKKVRQPWHITSMTGTPLALAGLWERWTPENGEPLESCTILTTAANEFVSDLHDRMPVILQPELFAAWLDPAVTDPERLKPLLSPCPDDFLTRSPVSLIVNNARNEVPECLAPVKVQRGLFDM